MNKLLIVNCLFFLLTSNIHGQNLSLTDLKFLLEHNIESADTYITSKGFEYHKAQKGESGDCDAMFWSFDRDINNDRAESFISKYCYEANIGFIWYQLGNKITFDRIKNQCKALGYKLTKTETNELNDLCFIFENSKNRIQFCSGVNIETNRNNYIISLKIK